MRKALGLLFAASLLVSVTAIASGSAGAAANATLPTCKAISGTQTFKPALPKIGDKTLVKPVTATTFKITGCKGGGITGGSSNSSLKATKATNCNVLVSSNNKPGAATKGTIKWSNGQTSTTSSVLTVTSKVGKTPITAKLVSKYTGGLGKGHQSTVLVIATPNKGACVSATFSKSTFKSTKITSK